MINLTKKKTKPSIAETLVSTSQVQVKLPDNVASIELADSSLEAIEPSPISTPPQLPTANISVVETGIQDRKQDIMAHLKRSSDNFKYAARDSKERNRQIREHIQKSLS